MLKYILTVFVVSLLWQHPSYAHHKNNDLDQKRLDQLLIKASEVGNISKVTQLIELGAHTVHSYSWSALHYAAFRQDKDLFKLLRSSVRSIPNTIYENKPSKVTLANAALLGGRHFKITDEETASFITYLKVNSIDIDHVEEKIPGRFLATQLGYGEEVLALFTYPPVQPVLPELKLKRSMKKSDWKIVQAQLFKLGVYKGTIDGIAGAKTRKSVYAYYFAFFEEMKERAETACSTGKSAANANRNHYFRVNRDATEIIGIKYVPVSNQKGRATYHGYRCWKAHQSAPDCQKDHRFCESEYNLFRGGTLRAEIKYFHLNKWSKNIVYGQGSRAVSNATFIITTSSNGKEKRFYGPPWKSNNAPSLWGTIEN